MNEEQAVLDFFAQEENLSLGLSVAEQMDQIRMQINSRFWQSLQQHFNELFIKQRSDFHAEPVEDRSNAEMRVGLQCHLTTSQSLFLFPMFEQQYLGGTWRIFYGLMWNTPPTSAQLALPNIANLKTLLADAGFKSNENFLAWQWSNLYPRHSHFLLRYSRQPQQLLDEIEVLAQPFLSIHCDLIRQANATLRDVPRSMAISLDQLRRKQPA